MAGSIAKRFTALLVFSGLVPASALMAQADGPCSSMVKVNDRASASAAVTIATGTYENVPSYSVPATPKSMNMGEVDFTDSNSRPSIKMDIGRWSQRALGLKSMALTMPGLSIDGSAYAPTMNSEFAYNGVIEATTGLTIFPKNLETLDDLRTDLVVSVIADGSPKVKRMWLTFSKADLQKADKQGAQDVAVLSKKAVAGECFPIATGGGVFMPGCFLTSAACDTIGLADDCWELATLRRFRDEWLARQPGGADDIAAYYVEAPAIAARLRGDPKALLKLYWTRIVPSAIAARVGMKRSARRIYHAMMRDLMTI